MSADPDPPAGRAETDTGETDLPAGSAETGVAPSARAQAALLYWRGQSLAAIARQLGVAPATVAAWKRRDGWDAAPPEARVGQGVEARLSVLAAKPDKTDADYREIDALGLLLQRLGRARAAPERTPPEEPPDAARPAGSIRRGKRPKNAFSAEQAAALQTAFKAGLYGYQRAWAAARRHRVRNILKSRQIGATWYFAREAIADAVETGDNQIFLSASRAQAHVFRQYIAAFVAEATGVDLKGDPIQLANGAVLYFLGTNSKTAQSYHGHVYLDEYAWIHRFAEFRKVASAMATHKRWRLTYFSTPSAVGHEAHGFWTGEHFNKSKAKADRADFPSDPAALAAGVVCPDGQWRHAVSIHDAAAAGCDLFDIPALQREYGEEEFANLFGLEWVDDARSFFGFAELTACGVDAWDDWAADFDPHAARPFGDRPVWIGYDPARSRDQASIAVVAPPDDGAPADGGAYRVLEKRHFDGADFQTQAHALRALTDRYTVAHIGIDATGIGAGVLEMVRPFFPAVHAISYSVESKSRMVLKAKHLISRRLLRFDRSWSDVIMAFMAIRRTLTASGRQATFTAARSETTGHADIAWAICHALDRTDFTALAEDVPATARGFVEFC